MSQSFVVHNYTRTDKVICISGPDEIGIQVDFDDVDHESVEFFVKRLVPILNYAAEQGSL